MQPGDVFHIVHVIAPPKQASMAPDFTPDVLGEDAQARCQVVSNGQLCMHGGAHMLPAITMQDASSPHCISYATCWRCAVQRLRTALHTEHTALAGPAWDMCRAV
jgi:hypothetical protein